MGCSGHDARCRDRVRVRRRRGQCRARCAAARRREPRSHRDGRDRGGAGRRHGGCQVRDRAGTATTAIDGTVHGHDRRRRAALRASCHWPGSSSCIRWQPEPAQAARANITPVTELAVARLAGDTPSAYYAAFNAASASSLTDAAAQAAATAAVDTLKSGGVDFSARRQRPERPAGRRNGAVVGDAYDQRLDALKVALAASAVTLPQLSQAVAARLAGGVVGQQDRHRFAAAPSCCSRRPHPTVRRCAAGGIGSSSTPTAAQRPPQESSRSTRRRSLWSTPSAARSRSLRRRPAPTPMRMAAKFSSTRRASGSPA